MEFLIPLLIFGAGLVFSGIKSANESKKQAQRKIDLSKLEKPTNKAPLPKRETREKQNTEKSLWQTLVDDFKEEYEKVNQEQSKTDKHTKSPSKRLEQDIRSKVDYSKQSSERKKTRPDRETETRTVQNVEPVQAVKSEVEKIGKESAVTSANEKKKAAFSVEDISFDEKAIVNGVIMNEILGPPKSKQRRRR